jgi:uncharacterized short protein YbdD (DUF466 family)
MRDLRPLNEYVREAKSANPDQGTQGRKSQGGGGQGGRQGVSQTRGPLPNILPSSYQSINRDKDQKRHGGGQGGRQKHDARAFVQNPKRNQSRMSQGGGGQGGSQTRGPLPNILPSNYQSINRDRDQKRHGGGGHDEEPSKRRRRY